MSFWQKTIRFLFYALFILVPLIFLPNTSELFEFNKLILTYIFVVLISACWICDCIIQKKFIFHHTLLNIPLLVFLGFSILSLVFSIDVHTSIYGYYSRWNGGLLSLVSYSILYWVFVTYFDAKSALTAIRYTLYATIPVALWAVAEHFGVDSKMWVQDVQNRVFSTIGQPNWLAAYIVSLIYLPLSGLLKSQISNPPAGRAGPKSQINFKSQILNFSIFILLFSVLLFTKSRSGLLAFGISSVVFWIMSFFNNSPLHPPLKLRGGPERVIPTLVFIFIIGLLSLVFKNPIRDLIIKSVPNTENRIMNTSTSLESGGTESGEIRKIVWTGAIRIWQGSSKNFWLGTGPETFAMAYYQYRPVEHNMTSEWDLLYNKAHNEYLNYLSTTGLLGLASYLFLLGAMGWVLFKSQIPNPNNQINSKNKIQNDLDLRILNLGFNHSYIRVFVYSLIRNLLPSNSCLLYLILAT